MFEAVMERTAWGGGEMGSTPTPRPPQASARPQATRSPSASNHAGTLTIRGPVSTCRICEQGCCMQSLYDCRSFSLLKLIAADAQEA